MHLFKNKILIVGLAVGLGLLTGCSSEMRMLNKIPVFKVKVKAVDTQDHAIDGAVVESTNGRETSTDSAGIAEISFGSVGLHEVTVMADNRAPVNFTVTMPADRGKTLTARMGDPVNFNMSSGMAFQGSLTNFYPMMFSWMFSSYGYSMDLGSYQPGDWTEWKISTGQDNEEAMRFRKAFLRKLDNGQQWWQIRYEGNSGDASDQYIIEVLFSKDRKSVRRIREQIGDEKPRERPVSEGWYTTPQKLTKESMEGAVVDKNLTVEVPAGSFTTDKLDFGVAPGIDLMLWKSDKVPGGVVQYETQNPDEDELLYNSKLTGYGSDAETVLGSY